MKTALVIHPYLSVYAGGEVVALHVINALVRAGYHVSIFSDVADVDEAKRFYPEVGDALSKADHVSLPINKRITLLPGMRMLNMAQSERLIYRMLENLRPDVAFSTQSSIFTMKHYTRLIHFTYDYSDLFVFSPFTRMRNWRPDLERLKFRTFFAYTEGRRLMRIMTRRMFGIAKPKPDLIATPSSLVLKILQDHGYHNSTTFVPPARNFKPKPKIQQVIQVARIVQAKRLEIFFEAARRLPDVPFVLIGRRQEGAVKYGEKLLSHLPKNVEFLEGNLKDYVDRLQESSIYCYTGRDRAIMLTVPEGISAGCYPIVSGDSSALDVANIARIGSCFFSIEQLVNQLKDRLASPRDPYEISKYAEPFRPEYFEEWVRKVAQP